MTDQRLRYRILGAGAVLICIVLAGSSSGAHADGEAKQGARVARQCIACHSFRDGQHMTGPSLYKIYGATAGKIAGFDRYSQGLRESTLVWEEASLDKYLKNPSGLVPGTTMTARLSKPEDRANLIAFLKTTQSQNAKPADGVPIPQPNMINLKSLGAASRVTSIRLCRDTYHVTLENGATLLFWERNLRIKTDSSSDGPHAKKPSLLPTGRHGDRAYLIFKTPQEISSAIETSCG